jgi:acyl-CoA oxidase
MPAPQVHLEPVDAAEIAEMLTFISHWLAGPDNAQLASSFGRFTGTPTATTSPSSAPTWPLHLPARPRRRRTTLLGTARFVAAQAVEIAVEKTALRALVERLRDVVPGRSDGDDPDAGLRDDAYHSGMLRFREAHMLSGVARRLKGGVDAGVEPFEVFNRCQDHVIAAGKAHVDRVVLEAFLTAVSDAPDGLRDSLKLLYDLHALATIEADRAWFIEHGRLSGERSKAITAMVNRLCDQVRPYAADLVDAFGIPPELLDVPLLSSP